MEAANTDSIFDFSENPRWRFTFTGKLLTRVLTGLYSRDSDPRHTPIHSKKTGGEPTVGVLNLNPGEDTRAKRTQTMSYRSTSSALLHC